MPGLVSLLFFPCFVFFFVFALSNAHSAFPRWSLFSYQDLVVPICLRNTPFFDPPDSVFSFYCLQSSVPPAAISISHQPVGQYFSVFWHVQTPLFFRSPFCDVFLRILSCCRRHRYLHGCVWFLHLLLCRSLQSPPAEYVILGYVFFSCILPLPASIPHHSFILFFFPFFGCFALHTLVSPPPLRICCVKRRKMPLPRLRTP